MALPSFSRNYGRSGAYENPATVVDTKTAEIWANTITNLGNQTAARLAEQQRAEAARIKNLQDKIAFGYKQRKENTKVVYDQLGKNGLNNPYLRDFASNKIDALTQLDLDMYNQTDPRALSEYNKKYDAEFQSMQNMKTTIGAMKESDAYFQEMMVDDTQVLSAGRAGGVAIYDNKDEQWLLGHMTRAGLGDGAVERFYDDEDGIMMVEYKGGIAGKGFTAVAADYFSYIPSTVPDDKKDLQQRFQDKNLLTENGNINPAYRLKENGEDVVNSSIDAGSQSIISYSPLNTAQIAGVSTITTDQLAANRLLTNDAQNSYTQNIRPFLVGKNISYKDGQQWPEELTFGNGTSGKSPYDDKSQVLYRQALASYAENMFGLNKTNQEVSRTKLTDAEYKRRMGIVDEPTAAERKAAKSAKEIADLAPRVYKDVFENTESYFKNKKIGDKDVLKVNVLPGSVPAGGGKVAPIIELGYKSGTSTKGGEQTIFTSDMIFDLSDPSRVRALIDMLPEGADMKKELKKLVGDNPIESVSIETFEQNPPIYKGISL